MSIATKYRPLNLDQVKGNNEVVESLRNMVSKSNPPHTFLFVGPTGCGKTTLARIVAKEFDCNGNDIVEIDSAQFRGIDTVRTIREKSSYMPLEGKSRCFIIDEVHELTSIAQDGLLKILEEPPKHVFFFLCTTEPQKLKTTVRGRCQIYEVKTLTSKQMTGLLRKVVREEDETLEKEVYEQIVKDSLGHPRNALNILEQVLTVSQEKRLNVAKKTAIKESQILELCRALIRGARWKEISIILNGLQEEEPESIRRAILGYCNSILLKEDNLTAGMVMEQMIEPFYNTGWPGLTFACYNIIKT